MIFMGNRAASCGRWGHTLKRSAPSRFRASVRTCERAPDHMGGVYACQTRSQAAAGSRTQQANENPQQQDRNALEETPPLHQLVRPPRVTIPDESEYPRY